jgi:membrane-associated phospholipid phosphatase
MRCAFAFLSVAFAALAVAVSIGAFSGLDQWAVDHLMPGAKFGHEQTGLLAAAIPLYPTHWGNGWSIAVNLVTLPASFFVALVLTAWRSLWLAAALVAGTVVETLCKETLSRPALHAHGSDIVGFDSSFPSGHTLRTIVVAAAFAHPLAAVWAAASIVLIEVAGWHTPSDIAGGMVLAALALLGARAAAATGALRGRRLARGRAR